MSGDSSKRLKLDEAEYNEACIICNSSNKPLTLMRDEESWATLRNAACVRNFLPILQLVESSEFPVIHYHRNCRSKFTLKKELEKITCQRKVNNDTTSVSSTPTPLMKPWLREKPGNSAQAPSRTVLEEKCIFCEKVKYIKGEKTREPLRQAVELRVDDTLRKVALEKQDTKFIALTSREIVAAEAHYHASCYKNYTRSRPCKEKSSHNSIYSDTERGAREHIYRYIRENVFSYPTVVTLVHLQEKMLKFMNNAGLTEILDSTKKHLKYHLQQEFGESLRFFIINNKVYIVPDTLNFELLLQQYVNLQRELELHKSENQEDKVMSAAKFLRSEIQKIDVSHQTWPPSPQQVDINIPQNLTTFLEVLLGNEKTIWSISQDIIQAVLPRKVILKKHVLLSTIVKTLTGNVELIKILNRLGHACNYSKLLEIETSFALRKLELTNTDEEVPLPAFVQNSIPTILAYDNIDRLEETLSGSGTSHRVNGVIIQPEVSSCAPEPSSSVRSKQRSIDSFNEHLPHYIPVARKNPPALSSIENNSLQAVSFKNSRVKNFVWFIARFNSTQVQSWTGFNICTRSNLEVRADSVGYLPTINAPATEMYSVQEILKNCLMIRKVIDTEHIVVVMDQALFSKACEFLWSKPTLYDSIILMMGNFHTICNLLSIIGKFFGDAGLRDLAVESGTIAEGSIRKVCEGRHYNRGVRMHKLIYEAMMRMIWKSFLEWLEVQDNAFFLEVATGVQTVSELFSENLNSNTFVEVTESPFIAKIFSYYESFVDFLRKDNGPLSAYWYHYIELVEILLGFIRSNREGDWNLYMYCMKEMLPWCFSMDKMNYARYLSFHYVQMTGLHNTDEKYYQHFLKGGFSVQMSHTNTFGRIPIDQVIEETVNKDTQTARGTRNFSLKSGAVSRYYLTAEFRAAALKEIRYLTHITKGSVQHPDLSPSRIRKDFKNVESLVQLLDGWTNPFELSTTDIVNLSNGSAAPRDIAEDLLSAKEKGIKACAEFQTRIKDGVDFYKPIKKLNIRTFGDIKAKKPKVKREGIQLQSDRQLFANMILIAESRKINMKDLFSYPLGPYPWALANADGTMKNTNKAALSLHLEKKISLSEQCSSITSCVIDGMSAVQKLRGENLTFQELATSLLKKILAQNVGERIDVVFDVYSAGSIKQLERENRGESEGITFHTIKSGHRIVNWRRILRNSDAKSKLINYIVESWKEESNRSFLRPSQTLYATYGNACIKINSNGSEDVPELYSNQEEADTRMMLHIQHASKSHKNILCISDDTDVFILCMYVNALESFHSRIYLKRCNRIVEIPKLVSALGKNVIRALPGLHAFTGCDTVSAFCGRGKVNPFNVMCKSERFTTAFSKLGMDLNVSNEIWSVLQEFTCQLYSRGTQTTEVNTLRYNLFRSKRGKIDSSQLPPCKDVLVLHTKRANYQAFLWQHCLMLNYPEPTLSNHGWVQDAEGSISIQWMSVKPAPDIILEQLRCKCKKQCDIGTCECRLNRVHCSAMCHTFSCTNEKTEKQMEDGEFLFTSSSSDTSDDDSDDYGFE